MAEPTDTAADLTLDIGGMVLEPGARIGPYVFRRVAGKGGMAHVVLAHDPDGRPVAVKVLKANRVNTGLARFKREFRALARLRHPNVIRVDAYGDLWGHPYIAMEFVEGTDLHQLIHAFRGYLPADRWRRCEEILIDLCRALAYIHRRGLVHRDLKPSNILIDADGRCKLTDFGIVKDLDPAADLAQSTTLVGTWAYASPEQIQGQPIDHRSDLYSLGIMLFAMLTGRRPFVAKDLAGYLELHRGQSVPSPRDADPAVPEHLDEICVRLLKKLPRDRYRSAQEILFRLELDFETDAGEVVGAWLPPLVGRDEEEARIHDLVAGLADGKGRILLLEGPEGAGKTRLLDAVSQHVALLGLPCLRERVSQREGVVDVLLRLGVTLKRELGNRASNELSAALAGFQNGTTSEVESPAMNARERLQDALAAGLRRISDDGPVVILVDDMHYAPLPTLDGLVHLARLLGDRPILLVGTLRPDRAPPRLQSLRKGGLAGVIPETMEIPPLPRPAIAALVDSLLGAGKPAQALTERLFQETEGSPLFLTLFLQHLMGQGILERVGNPDRPDRVRWRLVSDVEEVVSGHLEIPPGVRQVVRARLQPLDPAERELAEAVAVCGREMELDVLLDVLDLDEDEAGSLLDDLEDVGIIRQRRVGEQVWLDLTHSKFGDVLYRELDIERRSFLHRRIAATLELRYRHDVQAAEAIGDHYRRAGEAGKAWHYLIAAALRLKDRSLVNEAMDLCDRATDVEDAARVDLAPEEFATSRQELLGIRASVYYIRGDWQDARDAAINALIITTPDERAALKLRVLLGRILRGLGDLEGAEQEVQGVLERAREQHHRDILADALIVLAGVAWSRGDLDTCEARAQEGLVLASGPALMDARANLLLALTAVQGSRGLLASAASGLSEAQTLLKELRNKPQRALALCNLAEVLLGQGDLNGAWAALGEALVEAQQAGHKVGEMAARSLRGATAFLAGDLDTAQEELQQSVVLARTIPTPGEELIPAWMLSRLCAERGDFEASGKLAEEAARAAAVSDPEKYSAAVDAMRARLAARSGDADKAEKLMAKAIATMPTLPVYRRVMVQLQVARASFAMGDRAAALTHARAATHMANMRGFRLLGTEGLALTASYATGEEQIRARSELDEWCTELMVAVPLRWQASLRRRLGC